MFSFRSLIAAILVGSALSLSACDPSTGLAFDTDVNYRMNTATYAAADKLILQTQNKLPANVPLLVGTISDINHLETTTPLGRTIAEQVSSRFVQRGYTVSDVRFRNAINIKQDIRDSKSGGEYFLSRDTAVLKGEQDVGAALTGTYTIASDEVMVNLRLIEAANGRIIGATDYRMPLTDDIRTMTGESSFFKPGAYARDWNF